jgi:hypothetical protein
MSDAEDRKEARAVLKRLKDIPKNKLTVTQRANKTEAMGILSGRDTEQETYRPTGRLGSAVIKERIKKVAEKYPVKKKRHGGMTHVGLSPAEEARAGTMSEAGRARYMQGGGPIHTTFPKRAAPRTEGRETAIDLFPKVERAKGGKVGNKKSRGKRISNKQTDGNKLVASLYD